MRVDNVPVRIFLPHAGKHFEIAGDTFIKYCLPEHFFRLYNGFGISQKFIARLRQLGVRNVVIHYLDAGRKTMFKTTLQEFVDNGSPYPFQKNDTQIICSVDNMRKFTEE